MNNMVPEPSQPTTVLKSCPKFRISSLPKAAQTFTMRFLTLFNTKYSKICHQNDENWIFSSSLELISMPLIRKKSKYNLINEL